MFSGRPPTYLRIDEGDSVRRFPSPTSALWTTLCTCTCSRCSGEGDRLRSRTGARVRAKAGRDGLLQLNVARIAGASASRRDGRGASAKYKNDGSGHRRPSRDGQHDRHRTARLVPSDTPRDYSGFFREVSGHEQLERDTPGREVSAVDNRGEPAMVIRTQATPRLTAATSTTTPPLTARACRPTAVAWRTR
jgi:hypothetical protein